MSAEELLTALFNAAIAVSILATVLALGVSFTPAQLVRPLRRAGLVIVMVVLNSAAIPAIAWGLAEVFPIDDRYVGGLTLATLGAGSAGGLKAVQLSGRADLPLAVSLVVTLQLVNLIAVPLWAGQVVSGASISAVDILKSLLALVLLPLVVGLVVRARYPEHAARWRPELDKIGNLALVIALGAGISVNWDTITSLLGSWVLVASVAIVAVAGALGWAIGIGDTATTTVTGLASAMRFGSLGLIIIGTQLEGNADYLGPAITFALLDFVIPLVVALEIGRKAARSAVPRS